MADMIQATVVGRLTRDAEMRDAGGNPVLSFRVAATPYKKDALFFDVSLWGKRGEALLPYLGKGQQVVVTGELSERSYESGGETRTSKQIRANDVILVGAKSERESDDAGDDDDPLEAMGF